MVAIAIRHNGQDNNHDRQNALHYLRLPQNHGLDWPPAQEIQRFSDPPPLRHQQDQEQSKQAAGDGQNSPQNALHLGGHEADKFESLGRRNIFLGPKVTLPLS